MTPPKIYFCEKHGRPVLNGGDCLLCHESGQETKASLKDTRCNCPLPYRAIVPETHEEHCPVVAGFIDMTQTTDNEHELRCFLQEQAYKSGEQSRAKANLDRFERLMQKGNQQMTDRDLRDKISEIFVKNGLTTSQVAIGELWELMTVSKQPQGTKHLSNDEVLTLLCEEAAEVIQAATKCIRFGYMNGTENYGINRDQLAKEIGDFLGCVDALSLSHEGLEALKASRNTKIYRAEQAKRSR